jgi:hypothetical protein
MKTYFLSLLLTTVLFGCATQRRSGFDAGDVATSITAKDSQALKTNAKKLWQTRHVKADLEKSIETWEKLSRTDKADKETFQALAHGYYLLADTHEDDVEIKKALWEKGAAFGEKAMAMNPKFKANMDEKKSLEDSLSLLGKDDSASMYWTAANLGKWAKFSGIATQLKYKGRIKALIHSVEKVNPTYFHGAVARYWGGFFAVAPSFAGGDLKKSLESFNKSMKQAPHYLGTKVLMAEVYYTKKQDRKSFEKVLKEVIATSDNISKELMPENVLEKRKAQKLLKKVDDLF